MCWDDYDIVLSFGERWYVVVLLYVVGFGVVSGKCMDDVVIEYVEYLCEIVCIVGYL